MGIGIGIGMVLKHIIFGGLENCLHLLVSFPFTKTKLTNQTSVMEMKVIHSNQTSH